MKAGWYWVRLKGSSEWRPAYVSDNGDSCGPWVRGEGAVNDVLEDLGSMLVEQAPGKINLVIPLILHCPSCGERHIDEDEFATMPHATHACQFCGLVWRPGVVDTVGVRFLPGYGPRRAADEKKTP